MPRDEFITVEEEEAQMGGEGWSRDLLIKKIVVRDGVIYCQEWAFYGETMPCSQKEGGTGLSCGTEHVWLKCLKGKLFWACGVHKICNGPITFDVGLKQDEYPIDVDKAIETCKTFEQSIPDSVRDIYRATKTIGRRKRRRL